MNGSRKYWIESKATVRRTHTRSGGTSRSSFSLTRLVRRRVRRVLVRPRRRPGVRPAGRRRIVSPTFFETPPVHSRTYRSGTHASKIAPPFLRCGSPGVADPKNVKPTRPIGTRGPNKKRSSASACRERKTAEILGIADQLLGASRDSGHCVRTARAAWAGFRAS